MNHVITYTKQTNDSLNYMSDHVKFVFLHRNILLIQQHEKKIENQTFNQFYSKNGIWLDVDKYLICVWDDGC